MGDVICAKAGDERRGKRDGEGDRGEGREKAGKGDRAAEIWENFSNL